MILTKTEKISKEDIRTVLSYVTLKTRKGIQKFEGVGYKDRVESQEELFQILEKSFFELDTSLIDFKQFQTIIENVCSDVYFLILIFLLENKPFCKETLITYEKQKQNSNQNSNSKQTPSPSQGSKFIASPNLQSKFSPMSTIAKIANIVSSNNKRRQNK